MLSYSKDMDGSDGVSKM